MHLLVTKVIFWPEKDQDRHVVMYAILHNPLLILRKKNYGH